MSIKDFVLLNTSNNLYKTIMIPSNFTLDEVLKYPSLTFEELKEYITNLNISEILLENEKLQDEICALEEQIKELEYELDY